MKTKELRELTDDQLREKLAELGNELFTLRFTRRTGHLEKPTQIRTTRKVIAKIKTLLTQRATGAKA
jgi:large subunit ribosomal protein L29